MAEPAQRTDSPGNASSGAGGDGPAAAVLDFERPIVELERKIEGRGSVSRTAPELQPQHELPESPPRELHPQPTARGPPSRPPGTAAYRCASSVAGGARR